jgi:biotin-(acetyl-CoA carboxylase) ligase
MSRTSLSSILKNVQENSHFSGMALAVAYDQELSQTYVVGMDERGNVLVEDCLFPAADSGWEKAFAEKNAAVLA